MEYSKAIQQQALNLYLEHTPLSAVAEMDEMPSRATLYNWKSDGVLTDGVDWADYRDEVEANTLRRAAEKDPEGFWEQFEAISREALISGVTRIRDGQTNVRGSDLTAIARVLAKRDQLDEESKNLIEPDEAIKKFFLVMRANVPNDEFQRIFTAMKDDVRALFNGDLTVDDLHEKAKENRVFGK